MNTSRKSVAFCGRFMMACSKATFSATSFKMKCLRARTATDGQRSSVQYTQYSLLTRKGKCRKNAPKKRPEKQQTKRVPDGCRRLPLVHSAHAEWGKREVALTHRPSMQ
jgi:hypothetical protein